MYSLHLENGLLMIKGATKVISSTQGSACVETDENSIVASGQNIEVKKLNLEEKEVCFSGTFSLIKLSSQSVKQPLLKRIFK